MSRDNWELPFWRERATSHAAQGDALSADGKLEEAMGYYRQAASDEESAAGHARNELTRIVVMRSAATLWILAGHPRAAERIAMQEIAKGIEYDELRAEFRAIIRAAWKAQGFTAKSDRAESDAFVVQRKRVRTGIKRMLATKNGGAK